jgi:hypothetical protein
LQQNDLPLWLDPMLHMPEEQHWLHPFLPVSYNLEPDFWLQ